MQNHHYNRDREERTANPSNSRPTNDERSSHIRSSSNNIFIIWNVELKNNNNKMLNRAIVPWANISSVVGRGDGDTHVIWHELLHHKTYK